MIIGHFDDLFVVNETNILFVVNIPTTYSNNITKITILISLLLKSELLLRWVLFLCTFFVFPFSILLFRVAFLCFY